MAEHVTVTIEHGIAQVVLDRPEVFNAMDSDVLYALARHMTALAADGAVRAVVITGAGRAFSSGADLKSVIQDAANAATMFYTLAPVLHQSIIEVRRMWKPVIAAVNGVAAGAGMSLALACDFRVMARSAVFRQAYTSWGLCIDGGGTYMLPRLVGLARAMEVAAFDRPISAEQALAWGLVTKVVDDDQVTEEAMAMARELAGRSLHSFGLVKQLITDSFDTPLEVQLERERLAVTACGTHPDGLEGMTAFVEKRKPVYDRQS
jgi:2-(1,2-epoxy-1,2-dihydrophenyl)acetyl-CoA isomerase